MVPNTTQKLAFGEVIRKVQADDEVSYKLNSYGHRSDEFSSTHNGKHIIFCGCSNTFGEGLPDKKNWSGRLYEKISKDGDVSGYYNLSFLGGSIQLIVDNIYKYVDTFGAPDYIFCYFPDSKRIIKTNNNTLNYFNYVSYDLDSIDYQFIMNSFLTIRGLEAFCKQNKIKLFWGTWHPRESHIYKEILSFNDFVHLDYPLIYLKGNATISKEDKNSKYYQRARDDVHPGYVLSEGLAEIFYEAYKNRKD